MRIGEKIRQLRIHKKMTQDQLVNGISSVVYLSRIENGKIKPSKKFLEQIAVRLSISLQDLLENDISDGEKKITKIIRAYKETSQITEEQLNFLNMSLKGAYSTHIIVQIYTMLIGFYLDKSDTVMAKTTQENSLYIIPNEVPPIHWKTYVEYFMMCGRLFLRIQIYSAADHYYKKAEKLTRPSDMETTAKMYYNLSLVKQELFNNKTIALYYSKKAYELFTELGDTKALVKVLITRGVQYHLMGNYDDSLKSLFEARGHIDIEKDRYLDGMIEYNLGRVYQGLGDIDKAIRHFEKNLDINASIELAEENTYSLRRLIEIYQERKEWDKVNELLKQALYLAKNHNLNYLLMELRALQAKSYYMRNDEYLYEKEMQKIIEEGIKLKQNSSVKKLALELAHHFYKVRSYKKSADYFKIASEHEDQLESLILTEIE